MKLSRLLLAWYGALLFPIPMAATMSTAPLVNLNTSPLSTDVIYTTPLRGVTHMRVAASHAPPTTDQITTHIQALWPIKSQTDGHTAASAMSRVQRHVPGAAYQNITSLTRFSTQYAVECQWDDQPIWLIFDTGSSDTWAVRSDFACVSMWGFEYPQEACRHGHDYIDDFRYGELESIHFHLSFGSGEMVAGPMGLSDITVGDITVDKLQVGLANQTYWSGNNITNGILGLAYTSLTSAYYGPFEEHRPQYRVPYPPFVTTMVAQNKLENHYFSIALERNSSAGVIGWGGLPPVQMLGTEASSTDLVITNIGVRGHGEVGWKYSYYTIAVDGMQWDQTTDTKKFLYIVDTGTTLMYLPPPLAEAIAAAFEPRAVFLWQYGTYFAPCDAIPPTLSVIIGGVNFYINPADLVYRDMEDPLTGYCQIGIASGGGGPYILGDVFLQNVVAVFDVGAAQMRFYSRA